jgi:diaminobutyrate-2-oxoglutarate transaminase
VQFTGPTGTNAVETALKLARMVKRRSNIIAFTNGYHGLTMGSLAVTGNDFYRDEHYGARANADSMPYDGYFGPGVNTIEYLRRFISDKSSGVDLPAAIIVETVQGEGGINVAGIEWLQQLEALCREFDILLIIDDIQMGNGRTGHFFSFERAGIKPDMVTLSKSIGGGLPMALVLMRPELDQWKPGEHTGTFRGNNLAFVAAAEALSYWDNGDFAEGVAYKGRIMEELLQGIVDKYPDLDIRLRGIGMVWGLDFGANAGFPAAISREAFANNLVIELAGSEDHVLKFLPALTIDEETLREGMAVIDQAIATLQTKGEALRRGVAS